MVNMKLLEVVTPPYMYHGCSTRNTFWEENFTGNGNLFLAKNMKCFGRHNVRKHKEITGSGKYVTLGISLKLDSLNEMKTSSSDSKVKLERSG